MAAGPGSARSTGLALISLRAPQLGCPAVSVSPHPVPPPARWAAPLSRGDPMDAQPHAHPGASLRGPRQPHVPGAAALENGGTFGLTLLAVAFAVSTPQSSQPPFHSLPLGRGFSASLGCHRLCLECALWPSANPRGTILWPSSGAADSAESAASPHLSLQGIEHVW